MSTDNKKSQPSPSSLHSDISPASGSAAPSVLADYVAADSMRSPDQPSSSSSDKDHLTDHKSAVAPSLAPASADHASEAHQGQSSDKTVSPDQADSAPDHAPADAPAAQAVATGKTAPAQPYTQAAVKAAADDNAAFADNAAAADDAVRAESAAEHGAATAAATAAEDADQVEGVQTSAPERRGRALLHRFNPRRRRNHQYPPLPGTARGQGKAYHNPAADAHAGSSAQPRAQGAAAESPAAGASRAASAGAAAAAAGEGGLGSIRRRLKLRNVAGGLALTALVGFGGFYGLMHWCAPDLSRFYDRSQSLYDKAGNLIYTSMNSGDYYRILTTRSDVDPLYIKMLVAAEDERFYSHAGVDVLAVGRALLSNITSGRRVSGASTLAMQVCRLLEPKERSLWSKIREAMGALYLTHYYGREQLLSIYLTMAPFGGNIEGVTAASWIYFNHSPRHLTPAEAALLVALPRSPEVIRPDRHPESARYYRNEVLKKSVDDGVIKKDILELATAEEISSTRYPMPKSGYYLGQSIFNGRLQTMEIQALRSSLTALLAEGGFTIDGAGQGTDGGPATASGRKSAAHHDGDGSTSLASAAEAGKAAGSGAGAGCRIDGEPGDPACAADIEPDGRTGVSIRTADAARVNRENNGDTIDDVVASHLNSGNRMSTSDGPPALSLSLSPEALAAHASVAMKHQRSSRAAASAGNSASLERMRQSQGMPAAVTEGSGTGMKDGHDRAIPDSRAAISGPLPRELYTTIDPRVQQVLLDAASLYRKVYVGQDGQESLSMVVVDNDTFEVLGYVGALGTDLTYVDGAQALRSPGSTLKPFAYGMAFERGLLHPNSILLDAPRIYNNYQPRNYNRRFYGELTASMALQASLNLPAVEVMRAIGPYNFINRLNSMQNGLDINRHTGELQSYVHGRLVLPQRAEPDLSLVLGGCGITLFDLTQLYASLAHDGGIAPLRVLSSRRPSSAVFRKHASRAPLGRLAAHVSGNHLPSGSQTPEAATEVDLLKKKMVSSGSAETTAVADSTGGSGSNYGSSIPHQDSGRADGTSIRTDAATGAARPQDPPVDMAQVNALSGATPEPRSNYLLHGNHVHYQHLLSAPAARAVYNVLEGTPAPAGFESVYFRSAARISYKTGTSYRNRDAWAIGSSNNITLGIWTGRLDGSPAGNYTGFNHAAPLLFEVLSRLTSHDSFKRRIADDVLLHSTPPAGLDRVSIASLGLVTRRSYNSAGSSSGDGASRAATGTAGAATGTAAASGLGGTADVSSQGVTVLTGASSKSRYHSEEGLMPLVFTFPTDGTRLSPGRGGRVNVVFNGGAGPYFMLVNDELVPQLDYFEPHYNGFHTITIIDRNGNSISSQVWIEGVSVTSPELDHGYSNPDGPDYVDVTEEEEESGESRP